MAATASRNSRISAVRILVSQRQPRRQRAARRPSSAAPRPRFGGGVGAGASGGAWITVDIRSPPSSDTHRAGPDGGPEPVDEVGPAARDQCQADEDQQYAADPG